MLYRDEYFEQCMVQTRRFGEHICRNVLGSRRRTERTFDDMLATLKDNITGEEQEREFIDDLYFLKKHGNNSAHSVKVHKDGIEALECLQRAFEVAINYCVYSNGAGSKLLKLRYDTELLVTGVKSKKSLSDRYLEEKSKSKPKSEHKQKIQSYKMATKKDKSGVSLFWKFVGVCSFISAVMLLLMALIS
ncbi:TPA: hypothetical protein CPT90_07690 [Candidatus Gastranaerophilales bacterium HUM_3]|nr:MAG TPA: hypothetical protein CPT90_07690 [Candidatus Gastranaerophilales bacterium HUM_3]DAA87047.1 MAG TPA: hypothetical protein CPT99_05730 [Candidatus Gastranaerophilales bacterium HUM_4]DAA92466.1 MAG TPA: hypothetical protein CPT87_01780 [Candidatus Gastranaerophilales bacterium HUM_5]DAB16531.1 MAG TPA: hypothetical protein CPU00_02915 [Candidatus Gastranaerophilales bacterium HUM_18]